MARIFQLYSTPQKRGRLKRRWTEITWRLRCFTTSTYGILAARWQGRRKNGDIRTTLQLYNKTIVNKKAPTIWTYLQDSRQPRAEDIDEREFVVIIELEVLAYTQFDQWHFEDKKGTALLTVEWADRYGSWLAPTVYANHGNEEEEDLQECIVGTTCRQSCLHFEFRMVIAQKCSAFEITR